MSQHTRAAASDRDPGRGKGHARAPEAKTPVDITTPGWLHLLKRTWRAASSTHSSLDAAGIAFFGVWALFPALAALAGLGALVFGGREILALLSHIRIDLHETVGVIVGQLQAIAAHSRAMSSATLVAGLLLALWSAMRATRGLMAALNEIYQEEEKRGFWHRQALVLAFTSFGGVFLLAMLALILVIPPWVSRANDTPGFAFITVARWPVLVVVLVISLSLLYRYGPSRPKARWRWVSGGAMMSALIWTAGSLVFSYYASQVSRFNPLLGSLGAITLFFLWAYLTVVTVLLGAQVNAEMERQAAIETDSRNSKDAR